MIRFLSIFILKIVECLQGSNLSLKGTCKIVRVLFEATRKRKNQLTILLFALFPYNNV